MEDKLIIFQDNRIRRKLVDCEWHFSVVDVIFALTGSVNIRDYWYKLKKREFEFSDIDLSTFCRQLKMESTDRKMYLTDCADKKGLFRIITSKRAEPFKMWLAKVECLKIDEEIVYMRKIYKLEKSLNITSRNTRSIFPGDLRVARCFSFDDIGCVF